MHNMSSSSSVTPVSLMTDKIRDKLPPTRQGPEKRLGPLWLVSLRSTRYQPV